MEENLLQSRRPTTSEFDAIIQKYNLDRQFYKITTSWYDAIDDPDLRAENLYAMQAYACLKSIPLPRGYIELSNKQSNKLRQSYLRASWTSIEATYLDITLADLENNVYERDERLALHTILRKVTYWTRLDDNSNSRIHVLRLLNGTPVTLERFLRFLESLVSLDHKQLNALDETEKTPLQIALETRAPLSLIQFLLQKDDAPLSIPNDSGALPIHTACHVAVPFPVLRALVQAVQGQSKLLLRTPDQHGALPLHVAVRQGAPISCIRFLVKQGGRQTLVVMDREGALPLHLLCASGVTFLDVTLLCRAFPGFESTRNARGEWPVMMAATASSLDAIYTLLRRKVDILPTTAP